MLLPSLAFATGCTGGDFLQPAAAVSSYHAFGDSITFGFALADPVRDRYPTLLANARNLVVSDFAIPLDMSCDIPTRQIFPAADSPSLVKPMLYTIMIGTNDADLENTGPYEAIFNLCEQASIGWLALPVENKVLATSASVTTSGAGHLDTSNNWNAWVTDGAGSAISFPVIVGPTGALYVFYRIVDGNPGKFSYGLDGKQLGTGTTATLPAIATANGSNNSLALLRLSGIAPGAHVLTLTQTTAGSSGAAFVAIGLPPARSSSSMPHVLVGTVPLQLGGGLGYRCSIDRSSCLAYSADSAASVALFAGDGLNVQLFDSTKYMTGTSVDMADAAHPNPLGHQEILHSIQDVLQ